MTNLRKSLYDVKDIPLWMQETILSKDVFRAKVTEKTDGFVWEIGKDGDGFFVRSGTSQKMRKFGDFSKAAVTKFLENKVPGKPYDPIIALRLDLALYLTLESRLPNVIPYYYSVVGEMLLWFEGKIFAPNGTVYDEFMPTTFVIHTARIENWFLSPRELIDLKNAGNEMLQVDTDNREPGIITIMTNRITGTNLTRELEKEIHKQLPKSGKWGKTPEGYVIHHPSFQFKISPPLPDALSALYL